MDRALASGDEHAIKLTEAALRSFARSGEPCSCWPPPTPATASELAPRARRASPGPVGRFGAMEYRTLGRTGLKVSPLCLGAMMFGSFGNTDHDDSIRIIHAALDAGINFVDTADVYSFGESEEIVGKALAQTKRHKVVLATKVHGQMGQDPNAQGNSRRWIMAACDNSLRRLGVDYIDLYQIHRPSPETDIDETLGALTDLVRAGKIRYFGSSTFPAHEIVEAQWVAERRARERFVTEQPPYSILVRSIEKDVLPMCQKYGMGVLSWSPLAGGWLSGAFGPGKENTSRRATFLPHHYDMEIPGTGPSSRRSTQLTELADRAGLSLIQLALGFVLEHPGVTSPDHRAPHHGAPRVAAAGARAAPEPRRARPHRRDRGTGHRPQRHRRRLGPRRHRGRRRCAAAPAEVRPPSWKPALAGLASGDRLADASGQELGVARLDHAAEPLPPGDLGAAQDLVHGRQVGPQRGVGRFGVLEDGLDPDELAHVGAVLLGADGLAAAPVDGDRRHGGRPPSP